MGVDGFEVAEAPVGVVESPVGIAEAVEDLSLSEPKENGKLSAETVVNEPIKFGSHGDEPVEPEEDVSTVSEAGLRKEAVMEWPAPKKIQSFFFVKYRLFDDPKVKEKTEMIEEAIRRKNQTRMHILDLLKAKRVDRYQVISQLKLLTSDDKQFRAAIGDKRKEIEPLHQALGQLRGERGSSLCSSEEELNEIIGSLNYRIEHESIPLTEEKKLLREIRQLEQTRDKVIANVAMRTKIQDDHGKKETIQGQVKLIGENLDGVRKNHQILRGKIKLLEEELRAIDSDINDLQEELNIVMDQRDKAYETLQQLRKTRDEGNAHFHKNRILLNKARELASKKDMKALEELCHAQVEKFMSLWNDTKSFRDDYEKKISGSLDSRTFSRDGRIRNPDEKPLVVREAPAPVQTVTVQKTTAKQPPKEEVKEEAKVQVTEIPEMESLPTSKKVKEAAKKVPIEPGIVASEERDDDFFVPETPAKVEVDEATLREMMKQEEKEKAKQAMERKKKKEEKDAKKAAIRAENEAKKKQKDLEKKEKKKNAASAPDSNPEETSEAVSEVAEVDTDMSTEAPVQSRKKEDKENNAVRYRARSRGVKSVPKAIVKRKKATNYWLWIAPAVVVALILLVLGYFYAI